ncbi:MAG: hypothetical protein HUJ71_09070 [Pseudobutyrivibrio sp.]|nr:hypothetical protein [Pseudobutyrivibrio sp.]
MYNPQEEIDTFIGLRGRNHILAALIEGEPEDAFPPQLRFDEKGNQVEPLAADLRAREDVKFNKLFKTELMRLCAPLIGCTYDELRQRHRERRIRRIAYISIAVAAVAVAFGGYATVQNARINENYQAKLINQSKFLANTSSELLEQGDRRAASFVAAEGLSVNGDKPFVASGAYQLAEALHVYDNGRNYSLDSSLEHEANVETMNANSDCSRVVSTDASYNAYMWDTVSGTKIGFVPAQVSEEGVLQKTKAAFCCGDNILVVYEKMVTLFDCQGNAIWMYTDKKFNAYSASYNEDSDVLAVTDSINGVYLFQEASAFLMF